MKKLIFAVLAVSFMAVPMANAQKVNKDGILSKLAKCDADVADAKKGTKAATWINRGKAYYEAAVAPTKDIYQDMEMTMASVNLGKPDATNEGVTINGRPCTEMVYPWLKLYVADGKIVTWIPTQQLKNEDLAAVAVASYNKAYELDNKSADKVKEGLKQIENHYSQSGNVNMAAGRYGDAAYDFASAYSTQESPAFTDAKNASYLYYAGYLYVVDGADHPESFAKAADALTRALEAGYTDEEGNIYYYLFHAYYGQADSPVRAANMQRAKNLLMEGLAKFPKNDRIIEGLINVYTAESSVGDPTELIEMVDGALQREPKSKDLWYGRGRIFFSLKNYDESINSFKKVVEIDPKDAQAMFYIGYFYIARADGMNEEVNKRDYKSNAAWKEDQQKVTEAYKEAVPYLEKAYELNNNDLRTVESLKALTFRLRDEDGMQAKYEKYNKVFEELNAKQQ